MFLRRYERTKSGKRQDFSHRLRDAKSLVSCILVLVRASTRGVRAPCHTASLISSVSVKRQNSSSSLVMSP